MNILEPKLEKFGFNYLPVAGDPNFLSFIYIFIRLLILTFSLILAIFPLYIFFGIDFELSIGESAFFALIFIFFEEQSRWLFTLSSEKYLRNTIHFFMYFVLIENFLYFLSTDKTIIKFFVSRIPAILLHVVNSFFCYYSCFRNGLIINILFLFAITFHLIFNGFLGPISADWLVGNSG